MDSADSGAIGQNTFRRKLVFENMTQALKILAIWIMSSNVLFKRLTIEEKYSKLYVQLSNDWIVYVQLSNC